MLRPYGRAVKAKGRRLQVTTTVTVALEFGLTIEATPPIKPGHRKGVLWVPETEKPDLRIRVMGQQGPDVVLVSDRARELVALRGHPVSFECKNSEEWEFGPIFWKDGEVGFLRSALRQAWDAARRINPDFTPVVVLGKNRWPPLVAMVGDVSLAPPALLCKGYGVWPSVSVTTLGNFLRALDGSATKA